MWVRKELKKNAKFSIKKNYWAMISVCFIMAIFLGKYAASTTLLHHYDPTNEVTENVVEQKDLSNSDIVNSFTESVIQNENFINFGMNENATKGVLASAFNNVTQSRSYVFGILNFINQSVFKDRIGAGIVILLGAIINFLFIIFVANLIRIGENRFFLENHLYHKTRVGRIFFLFKIRKIWNPAKVMFFKDLFLTLWFFTIVGFAIKLYSYRMIPYILAENPQIPRKAAFQLSMQMMQGNKWKAFQLDLSFTGWFFLEVLTGGLAGIFFVNPYYTATFTELYLTLRRVALEEKYENSNHLNDPYLEALPGPELLKAEA